MTPAYRKIIDSCSCLTPVTNREECKETLIYQKHYDEKTLLLRILFQSKISTPGPALAPAKKYQLLPESTPVLRLLLVFIYFFFALKVKLKNFKFEFFQFKLE